MSDLTNFAEVKLLNHFFGKDSYEPPTIMYIALSTSTPNEDGSNITEPIGGAYSRVEVVNSLDSWTTSTNGVKSNKIDFKFPEATSTWGNITYAIIYDQSTGGNALYKGEISQVREVSAGDVFQFRIGDFKISFTNLHQEFHNTLLDFMFGKVANDPLDNQDIFYIGLSTGPISGDGSNIAQVEVTGGLYARAMMENAKSVTGWASAVSGEASVSNSGIISFAKETADIWSTATHYLVATGSITGSSIGLYASNSLNNPKTVSPGNTLSFPSGSICITLD